MVHNISKAQPVFSIKQSLVYLLIWNQKRIVEHCWANIASWELCAGNYPSECSFLPIITDDTADARGTAQTCQKGKIRRKVGGKNYVWEQATGWRFQVKETRDCYLDTISAESFSWLIVDPIENDKSQSRFQIWNVFQWIFKDLSNMQQCQCSFRPQAVP